MTGKKKNKIYCCLCGQIIWHPKAVTVEHMVAKASYSVKTEKFLPPQDECVDSAHFVCNQIRGHHSFLMSVKILDTLRNLIGTDVFNNIVNTPIAHASSAGAQWRGLSMIADKIFNNILMSTNKEIKGKS